MAKPLEATRENITGGVPRDEATRENITDSVPRDEMNFDLSPKKTNILFILRCDCEGLQLIYKSEVTFPHYDSPFHLHIVLEMQMQTQFRQVFKFLINWFCRYPFSDYGMYFRHVFFFFFKVSLLVTQTVKLPIFYCFLTKWLNLDLCIPKALDCDIHK